RSSACSWQQILQVIVVLAELAAVVSGGDPRDAFGSADLDKRLEPRAHGVRDRLRREAVDDDLEHGDGVRAALGFDCTLERRTERVVGGGDGALVLGADLRS